MSRSTPRKARQRNHASNSGPPQVGASDYESDAAHYAESNDVPRLAHLPTRTNTDLNLSVLRRYLPDIRSILSIAANAVVYTFSEASQGWDKHGVEGTMFVCEQEPIVTPTGQALSRVCVFVLNRRGLDNLAVDLVRVSNCEMADELIIFQLEEDSLADAEDDGAVGRKVIGIWIHADEDDTREVNTNIIRGAWQQARLSLNSLVEAAEAEAAAAAATAAEEADQAADQTDVDDGGALADSQADMSETTSGPSSTTGRRLSITDLFGPKNGAG